MQTNSDLSIKDFEPLFYEKDIKARIHETAARLDTDYAKKNPTLIAIMKGAIHITSDLSRALTIPHEIEFIQTSSYGQNGMESGQLTLFGLDRLNLQDKDVLLVDDIFDTGKTIVAIKEELLKLNPASLKTLVLLTKNKKRDTQEVPDYSVYTISDRFVIGYGLDYKEQFRGLPDICVKKD